MKKFINFKSKIKAELLEGLALAFKDIVTLKNGNLIVNKSLDMANRVTVVTQGGAGHEPALSGFVGEGMADISVVGDIFTAPSPADCMEALQMAQRGKGVLYITLNHAGEIFTSSIVMQQAEQADFQVKRIVVHDDISNAPRDCANERRGMVGCVPVVKIAGAAASAGKSLDEVYELTKRFSDNMATLAVAVKSATHPCTGSALAAISGNDMEIGVGQHGEGGGTIMPMLTADDTADIMLNALLKDTGICYGDRIMLLINGTGATTLMEQLIVYRRCATLLEEMGIEIVACNVGELLTIQEQAGFQMLIAKMDDELIEMWNMPCNAPYFKKI